MSATVRIVLRHEDTTREVEVACEAINKWLCITPEVAKSLEDDSLVLSGKFVVTHIQSGFTASQGSGCIECARYLGQKLSALDWASAPADISKAAFTSWLSDHEADVLGPVKAAIDLSWLCDSEDCDRTAASFPASSAQAAAYAAPQHAAGTVHVWRAS